MSSLVSLVAMENMVTAIAQICSTLQISYWWSVLIWSPSLRGTSWPRRSVSALNVTRTFGHSPVMTSKLKVNSAEVNLVGKADAFFCL